MITSPRSRSVFLAQNGTLLFLLVLLFLFARGPDLLYGALSLLLLAAYHALVNYYFTPRQILQARLMTVHLGTYLLLCTLVIRATTEADEESLYWIVYLLPITTAAANLNLLRTLAVCCLSSLLYGALFPQSLYLNPQSRPEELPELLILVTTFFIIGVLVQSFSESQRRSLDLQEKLNRRLISNRKTLQDSLRKLRNAEENLRRKDRLSALGRLSAGMAHEIRNPLGIISSSVQLLAKKLGPRTDDIQQLVSVVQEEVQRLNGLINDFIKFGRPAAPDRHDCDIRQLVERTVQECQPLAQQRDVQLVSECPTDPLEAWVDSGLLRQALLNLVINALEATPPQGQVKVRLRAAGQGVRFEIHNTGSIIPEEMQSRIFDLFVTTKDRGSGLGLANAHQIVIVHGGEMRVHSTPEDGTMFSIWIPLREEIDESHSRG
ncbi:MAG: PAS domain-containing sensor histidine kinase [Pedobacter sp.]